MKTKINRIFSVLFLTAFLVAPLFVTTTASAWFSDSKVKVMTQNLYLGADIFKVVDAAYIPDPNNPTGPPIPNPDPLAVPTAVAELFQTIQYTNFPERAEAIANEIWVHRPQLIGLNEASIFYIQSPGDAAYGGKVPAEDVVYDYLDILLNALSARGLNYKVAVEGYNADVEMPMLTGYVPISVPPYFMPTFDDVRMVDRDVILVRGDVDSSNPISANYLTNLSQTIGGVNLEFTRGWVGADVKVDGGIYRFVSTHLEVRSSVGSGFRAIQAAQMQELLTILSAEPKPIILVGDMNSSPDDVPGTYDPDGAGPILPIPYVPPYMLATDYFGYTDAWDRIFFPRNGFTDGFSETLDDPNDKLTSRIDMVFLQPKNKRVNWVTGTVVGDNRFNMTPSGLWPSDHGGVVTWISFSK